ncbi:c-type cytochrome [Pseudoroseicyclus tamaricis]|uniref:Cytochrome c n=1 Tax=Pseudoroseicyclus tamaricis TaxID=2705421 RepID=A0A6B2K2E1_9RHOB|nr:cytochrome c [Pseudoroseicyclus tamaricis]NDV00616.1 cytochrome c [Pseudoroseicyclus tamaricis]
MSARKTIAAFLIATSGLSAPAFAQGMDPMEAAVRARQSHMFLQQVFLMQIGAMVQGNAEYDADTAAAAAANLAAVSSVDPFLYFPEGTSTAEMEGTRALPAIWEDPEAFAEAWEAMDTAASDLSAVAGDGLSALQGAFGPVGMACGSCHRSYRQSD